jgi:hypothetical protein
MMMLPEADTQWLLKEMHRNHVTAKYLEHANGHLVKIMNLGIPVLNSPPCRMMTMKRIPSAACAPL